MRSRVIKSVFVLAMRGGSCYPSIHSEPLTNRNNRRNTILYLVQCHVKRLPGKIFSGSLGGFLNSVSSI